MFTLMFTCDLIGNTCRMEAPSLEAFEQLHRPQLQAIGFPQSLLPALHSQLAGGGDRGNLRRHFDLVPAASDGAQSCTGLVLETKTRLPRASRVFVLLHAWESDGGVAARSQLLDDPALLARIEGLLGIRTASGENPEATVREMARVVSSLSGKTEAVANRALAETGYGLVAGVVQAEDLGEAGREEQDKPGISFEEFKQGVVATVKPETAVPDSDLRCLYQDYLKRKAAGPLVDGSGCVRCGRYSWTDGTDEGTIAVSVSLPPGTKKRDVVSKIRARHWMLGVRGATPIIDGDFTGVVVPDECVWTLEKEELAMTLQKARPEEGWGSLLAGEVQLGAVEVERAASIGRLRAEARADAIWERMWHVNQTYQAVTPEGDQKPVWYLMEPHGLALVHSDTPNFSCRPFANALSGKVMSLLWPVRDVGTGEVCSRDCVPQLFPGEGPEQRRARRETILGFSQDWYQKVYPSGILLVTKPLKIRPCLPPRASDLRHLDPLAPVKVFVSGGAKTEWTLTGYEFVRFAEEADVMVGNLPPTASATGRGLVARLEGDEFLVSRSQLCKLARDEEWFPWGVDLREEPAAILGEQSLVNSWHIVLPDERGFPIQPRVTRSKVEMIRWAEVARCVASRFLLLTVLHEGRRCCLQFTVIVRGGPRRLEAFLHPRARVRLAEKKTAGFRQWDTAALLTSANCTVPWAEFLRGFTERYKAGWAGVQAKVNQAIAALLTLALARTASGWGALYTVDVMVRHPSLEPVVIGVDPLPAFEGPVTARQCLDLLVARTLTTEDFIQLLPLKL